MSLAFIIRLYLRRSLFFLTNKFLKYQFRKVVSHTHTYTHTHIYIYIIQTSTACSEISTGKVCQLCQNFGFFQQFVTIWVLHNYSDSTQMMLLTTVTLKHCRASHLITLLLKMQCTWAECLMMVSVPESHILAMVEIAFNLFLSPQLYEITRPTSEYLNLNPYLTYKT
jgi:hypothetical protein